MTLIGGRIATLGCLHPVGGYWNALKVDKRPASLSICRNEGHGFRDPTYVADLQHRIID
jgi:hypothetical protein